MDTIKIRNSKDTFMLSFDVQTLFTNVPLEEIIKIITDKLYSLEKIKRKNFIKPMFSLVLITAKQMVWLWVRR